MSKFACLPILALVTLIFAGCNVANMPQSMNYSFERGLEGWTTNGTDLDNPPDQWSIEPSRDMASKGETSLKFYLDNVNDAGKIWITRSFDVEPETHYQVEVTYKFASADYGGLNLWKVITGVALEPPRTAGELVYQGDTGNGAGPDDGWVWQRQTYNFDIRTGPEKELYVTIGVWGTWEAARTYYLDDLDVTFIKEQV
jgi:hypothetical protein